MPHEHGLGGTEDVGLRNIVIEGVNGYDLVQTGAKNPVVNPPFNNWSVNQPSVPHDHGLAGDADLGQNIIVDGHAIKFAQKEKKPLRLAQIVPVDTANNEPGNFNIVEKDYEHDPSQLIQLKEVDNAPGVFAIVDTDDHQSIE